MEAKSAAQDLVDADITCKKNGLSRINIGQGGTEANVNLLFESLSASLVQSQLFDVIRRAVARGGHGAMLASRVVTTLCLEEVWNTKLSGRINRRRRRPAGKSNRNLQ